MCSKFLILCCVAIFLCCMLKTSKATKKNLEVTSFLSSSKYDNSWIDWKTLRLTKTAPNQFVISGDITVHYNLGDEQLVDIKVLRKDALTNNYKNIFVQKKPICKYIATDQLSYPTIMKYSNFPPNGTCPFPKGDYKITNYVMDVEKFPKTFPSGEYKIVTTILDGPRGVAALEMETVFTDGK